MLDNEAVSRVTGGSADRAGRNRRQRGSCLNDLDSSWIVDGLTWIANHTHDRGIASNQRDGSAHDIRVSDDDGNAHVAQLGMQKQRLCGDLRADSCNITECDRERRSSHVFRRFDDP